jgi:hypothetical protein
VPCRRVRRSAPAGPSWWQGMCHLEQHNKRPCVQSVRKDPTDRLECLISGSPLPTAEGVRQPHGKARVWVAPPHSLPPTGNQQYPRGINSEPIIMETNSRTPVCIFSFLRGERPALGLAIGYTRQYTARGVERLYAKRVKVASLREPRRLDPAVDLLFMVNPCQINVKLYLC